MFTKHMTRTEITHRTIPTVREAAGHPLLVTLARAAKLDGQRFVFAAQGGYHIDRAAPATGSFYEFSDDGSRWLVER